MELTRKIEEKIWELEENYGYYEAKQYLMDSGFTLLGAEEILERHQDGKSAINYGK